MNSGPPSPAPSARPTSLISCEAELLLGDGTGPLQDGANFLDELRGRLMKIEKKLDIIAWNVEHGGGGQPPLGSSQVLQPKNAGAAWRSATFSPQSSHSFGEASDTSNSAASSTVALPWVSWKPQVSRAPEVPSQRPSRWARHAGTARKAARRKADARTAQWPGRTRRDMLADTLKSLESTSGRGVNSRRSSLVPVHLGKLRSQMVWSEFEKDQGMDKWKQRWGLSRARTVDTFEAEMGPFWRCVHGSYFQIISSTFIVLNAMLIGAMSEVTVRSRIAGQPESQALLFVEWGFSAYFALELFVRLAAEKCLFFNGPEWRWNLFDSILVVSSVADILLNGLNGGGGEVTTARMIRFVRFIRIIRIARAVRAFQSLRIVVFAIFESMASLLWCFTVVGLILYVFAICFMHGVSDYLGRLPHESTEEDKRLLIKYYGTVLRAVSTLFMSITGGVDWIEAMTPLKAIHWLYEPFFTFYVFFMVVGVLNVVVGAFVATTADISSKDREFLVKAEMSNLKSYRRRLKTFFAEADKDRSGKLSWEEFKAHLKTPKVSAYFRALELDVSQAHVVFKLLDRDGSNEVSLDEFLAGCLRLKGQAKALDVQMLLYENRRLFDKLSEYIEAVTYNFRPSGQSSVPLQPRPFSGKCEESSSGSDLPRPVGNAWVEDG
mmetsp:Transcript_6942/g.16411  ORF Transcript_6942/g.16411 Transcript_6942/m.16411 type:complete len:664 (-) Transcript_6942:186-2177(-)